MEDLTQLSRQYMTMAGDMAEHLTLFSLSQEADELFQQIHATPLRAFAHQKSLYRKLVASTGTNVDENDRDPYGDGDQTLLPNDQCAQVFRNMWNEGADASDYIQAGEMSRFAILCIQGNKAAVEKMLKASTSHTQLLERRETAFRTPPLLLAMGFAKHVDMVKNLTGCHESNMDIEGVAKVLLRYGARPDVKDVCGKTPVHWGAGCTNTQTTRNVADFCIQAAKSCRHVGKEVQLHGLSNQRYNGRTGILGGYLVDEDRRVVQLDMDDTIKEVAFRPKNIMFNGQPILEESFALVDVPDRTGSVALHEVIMSRDHCPTTERFLCDKHNASVDVAEIGGVTPRFMVMRNLGGMGGEVMNIVKARACRSRELRRCSLCHADTTEYSRCSRCFQAHYCSPKCQKAHWPMHKKTCREFGIKLDRAACSIVRAPYSALAGSTTVTIDGRYRLPEGISPNERFWLKVQCAGDPRIPHLAYDKTRTCDLVIPPGTAGYHEIGNQVRAEKRSLGKKAHFRAVFDAKGDLTVFPHSANLLQW